MFTDISRVGRRVTFCETYIQTDSLWGVLTLDTQVLCQQWDRGRGDGQSPDMAIFSDLISKK